MEPFPDDSNDSADAERIEIIKRVRIKCIAAFLHQGATNIVLQCEQTLEKCIFRMKDQYTAGVHVFIEKTKDIADQCTVVRIRFLLLGKQCHLFEKIVLDLPVQCKDIFKVGIKCSAVDVGSLTELLYGNLGERLVDQ